MANLETSVKHWARDEVFTAALGDRRLSNRAASMLTRIAERPAGTVTQVFSIPAEQQAAYDFLRNPRAPTEALMQSFADATFSRLPPLDTAYIAVDGTSLSLTELTGAKGFGHVGSRARGARGVKVLNAYAISAHGVPVGLTSQQWWVRTGRPKKKDHKKRKLQDKETLHWVRALQCTWDRARQVAPLVRLCFLLDREADGFHTLLSLADSGHDFIVRSAHDRCLPRVGPHRPRLRTTMKRVRPSGDYRLQVTEGQGRRARMAKMVVRFRTVTLVLRDQATGACREQELTVVWAHETGSTPKGENALDWMLLTSRTVTSLEAACEVIYGYSLRWRIEEFHRTWKSGTCDIESSQLRTKDHLIKWATLMATHAARVERLKMLARTTPEVPATQEMSSFEVEAVVMLRTREKKRTDPMPSATPTLGEAVLWTAYAGGYTGKSSGGPPGSVTLSRGLERVVATAAVFEHLRRTGQLR